MIRYVWLTWWGNGKGHSSNDLGYWLSIYAVLSLLEGLSVTVCIASVKGHISGSDNLLTHLLGISNSFLVQQVAEYFTKES